MAHILVVDDQKDFRDVMRIFLERLGHDVLDAEDGTEALYLCQEHRPDVVILDVFMPGKDGIEALWQIRDHNWARRVIVVSAGRDAPASADRVDSKTVLDVARQFGADFVLAKPIDPRALLDAVDSALRT